MENLQEIFIYTFASIFSIVNPFGMAPIFLGLTKSYAAPERHKLAYRVACYGTILLVTTLLLGPFVLRFFGISLPFIQIAGGCLAFYTAWEMLSTKPRISTGEELEAQNTADIAFFPLTMPITAGAGSLAITISIALQLIKSEHWLEYIGVIGGIIAVFILVAVSFRFADSIFNRLGKAGTNVITRLAAFILLAIGVQIVWTGLKVLIESTRVVPIS